MKILVANRGEIACRIIASIRELGLRSVAIYTEPDADAPHVYLADEAAPIGAPLAYLDIATLIGAMKKTGARAVHPGYGFLSQSARFAAACREAGVTFIGPSPEAMLALGDKRASRELAVRVGVPVVPGAETVEDAATARREAERVGYPVLLKAAGGGGGKGMRRVNAEAEMAEAFGAAQREAKGAFNDDRMLIEKYVFPARHVEVQVLGDGKRAIAHGERECSLQRRYQKVVEEAPAATVSEATRRGLYQSAIKVAEAAGYASAGTVEFLVGADGAHYFLEVNTRLQVEHPVTELLTGLDIVRAQIELALGGSLPAPPAQRGHAIEARLNAEDPYHGFLPQTGRIEVLELPHLPGLRIDAGVREGSVISPHYDSLIAKIIAHGQTREQARSRLLEALRATTLLGLVTNQSYLQQVLESDFFIEAETFTTTLEGETFAPPAVPDWVQAAGERALARKADDRTAAGTPRTDRWSPWQSLGGFRMGS